MFASPEHVSDVPYFSFDALTLFARWQAVDADGDGKVGLSDYINFAARLKEIHSLQQLQDASDVLDGSPLPCHARLLAPTPE